MADFKTLKTSLEKAETEIPGDGPRVVIYIPFDKATCREGEGDLMDMAATYKANVALRALAIAVNKEKTGVKIVDEDSLAQAFYSLSPEKQTELLQKAAGRVPLILQHGEPSSIKIKATDTVVVSSHGDLESDYVSAVPDLKKSAQQKLGAGQLMDRMLADGIPTDVSKIKLDSCGSGGGLHAAFIQVCTEKKIFEDATIRGYGLESLVHFPAPLADLDKGLTSVTPEGPTLKMDKMSMEIDRHRERRDQHRTELSIHDDKLDRLNAVFREKALLMEKLGEPVPPELKRFISPPPPKTTPEINAGQKAVETTESLMKKLVELEQDQVGDLKKLQDLQGKVDHLTLQCQRLAYMYVEIIDDNLPPELKPFGQPPSEKADAFFKSLPDNESFELFSEEPEVKPRELRRVQEQKDRLLRTMQREQSKIDSLHEQLQGKVSQSTEQNTTPLPRELQPFDPRPVIEMRKQLDGLTKEELSLKLQKLSPTHEVLSEHAQTLNSRNNTAGNVRACEQEMRNGERMKYQIGKDHSVRASLHKVDSTPQSRNPGLHQGSKQKTGDAAHITHHPGSTSPPQHNHSIG